MDKIVMPVKLPPGKDETSGDKSLDDFQGFNLRT